MAGRSTKPKRVGKLPTEPSWPTGNAVTSFTAATTSRSSTFNLEVQSDAFGEQLVGIYFHTQFQNEGWPKYGFEAQVNNSPVGKKDPKKTGSLYAVKDVLELHVKDNEWYTETVTVKGKHVTIKINDQVVTDYTEPDDKKAGDDFTRKIDKGTFALQAHDPGSTVHFKNIRVKRLD